MDEKKTTTTTEIDLSFGRMRTKEMLYHLDEVTFYMGEEGLTREAYEPAVTWLFMESHDGIEREEKYRLICRYARPGRPLTLRLLEEEIKPCYERVQAGYFRITANHHGEVTPSAQTEADGREDHTRLPLADTPSPVGSPLRARRREHFGAGREALCPLTQVTQSICTRIVRLFGGRDRSRKRGQTVEEAFRAYQDAILRQGRP